jgi:Holliday junction resolvase YEN1
MAYQGQEKLMFYRICRFLTLNIQLISVFDGPGRPWKRGGRGNGKIDYGKRDLLKDVLRSFGIPYHEAPGEAEAECARMQILGMVDAVWSQDSDCLMFGCTLWIRDDRVVKEKGTKDRSKENTQKDKKTARVVRAKDLKDRLQIDREGLVLFAMLVGGDYDTTGLPGCGPSMALKAIRKGLGQTLCVCRSQRDCDIWRTQLIECLPRYGGRGSTVPIGFPDYKTLMKYNSPKVTGDEALKSNARLNLDHMRPIDELKLLEVTSSRFNIWGRLYMNWVGPVLLTRSLSSRSAALPREAVHGIKLVKEKPKNTDDALPIRVFERKLSFSPLSVTTLRREDFEGDRIGYWNGDMKALYDPDYRVDKCELPNYWLQKVIPPDVLDPPPAEPKCKLTKRKQQTEESESPRSPVTAKRQQRTTVAAASPSITSSTHARITPSKPPRKKASTSLIENAIELSDSEDELCLPPPRLASKSSVQQAASKVVDLGSPSSSEIEFDATQWAAAGLQIQQPPSQTKQHQQAHQSSLYDAKERDLQLALRMSVQEHTATSSSLPHTGNDDSILYSIPPLVSESTRMLQLPIAPTTKQSHAIPSYPSSVAPKRAEGHLRPVPTNAIDAGLYVARPRPTKPSTPLKPSFYPPHTLSTTSTALQNSPVRSKRAESGAMLADTLPTDEVRAARLRHFQKPVTSSPTVATSTSLSRLSPTPTRSAPSVFRVPAGADCVDLTDD